MPLLFPPLLLPALALPVFLSPFFPGFCFWIFSQSSGGAFACHLVGFGWLLPLLLLSGGDGLSQSGEGDGDCLILALALFKA